MATSFQKTYTVTVTFTKEGETLTEDDVQAVELRDEIKKAIARVANRQKGVYQSIPGDVTET